MQGLPTRLVRRGDSNPTSSQSDALTTEPTDPATWSTDVPHYKKINHHYTYRRSYAKFNEACFLSDLSSVPFSNIYNTNDPNQAADTWCDTFLTVLSKHAPLKRHRVRISDAPAWMTEESRQAMKLRDKLKKEGKFEEFKNTFQKIVNTGFTCFF